MLPENKRTKRKSTPSNKRKRGKPKVSLDLRFVLPFTLVVVILCLGTLLLAFYVSGRKETTEGGSPAEETVPENVYAFPPEESGFQPRPDRESAVPPEETPGVTEAAQAVEPPRIASVVPPKEAREEEIPPAPAYDIPDAVNGAVLVFVIDDGGYSLQNLRRYTSLPFPIAVAVLPRLPGSKECADLVRKSGKEVMLHQPMQAQNLSLSPGEGAILPDMSTIEVYNTVVENISEIGPVAGMNNHEGSLITSDGVKMGAVMDAVYDAGIFFLDSRTTADTRAPAAALERGIEILERDVFIDDEVDRDKMLSQILRGLDIANRKGKAIMIGHVDKSAKILPDLLLDMYPSLTEKGFRIVFPSDLITNRAGV